MEVPLHIAFLHGHCQQPTAYCKLHVILPDALCNVSEDGSQALTSRQLPVG